MLGLCVQYAAGTIMVMDEPQSTVENGVGLFLAASFLDDVYLSCKVTVIVLGYLLNLYPVYLINHYVLQFGRERAFPVYLYTGWLALAQYTEVAVSALCSWQKA